MATNTRGNEDRGVRHTHAGGEKADVCVSADSIDVGGPVSASWMSAALSAAASAERLSGLIERLENLLSNYEVPGGSPAPDGTALTWYRKGVVDGAREALIGLGVPLSSMPLEAPGPCTDLPYVFFPAVCVTLRR